MFLKNLGFLLVTKLTMVPWKHLIEQTGIQCWEKRRESEGREGSPRLRCFWTCGKSLEPSWALTKLIKA